MGGLGARALNNLLLFDTMVSMKTLSEKVNKELANVARDMGVSKETALRKALLFYRKHQPGPSLRDELLLWDRASTEDFAGFEQGI